MASVPRSSGWSAYTYAADTATGVFTTISAAGDGTPFASVTPSIRFVEIPRGGGSPPRVFVEARGPSRVTRIVRRAPVSAARGSDAYADMICKYPEYLHVEQSWPGIPVHSLSRRQ